MRTTSFFAALTLFAVVAALGHSAAEARPSGSPNSDLICCTEGPPQDDLGITLIDMLALGADTLAAYQDQVANESYLGSKASSHRLRTAILRAPDVTLRRGATPLIEGWFLDDDD
jgi:hypothetical protein